MGAKAQTMSVSKTPSITRRDLSKDSTPSATSNLSGAEVDVDDEKSPPNHSNLSPRIHRRRFSISPRFKQRQIMGSRKGSRRHSLTDSVDAAPSLGSRQL